MYLGASLESPTHDALRLDPQTQVFTGSGHQVIHSGAAIDTEDVKDSSLLSEISKLRSLKQR